MQHYVDSLQDLSNSDVHDTIKIKALYEWDDIIYSVDPELDLELNNKIIELCKVKLTFKPDDKEKEFYRKNLANSLNNLGLIYKDEGKSERAISYFNNSIKIEKELNNLLGIARSLNNIGLVYSDLGDVKNAMEHYTESKNKYAEIEDNSGIAMVYNNIGIIYHDIGDIENALKYYLLELEYEEKAQNNDGIASSLNNIAVLYSEQGNTDKGFEYFHKVLDLRTKLKDKNGIANANNNLGLLCFQKENYKKALHHYKTAIKLFLEIGNKSDLGSTYGNLGQTYHLLKDTDSAIYYVSKGKELLEEVQAYQALVETISTLSLMYLDIGQNQKALELGLEIKLIAESFQYPNELKIASFTLFKIYEKLGNGMKALKMHKLFIEMRDSLQNEKSRTTLIRQEANYKYEKQKAIDDLENKKLIALEQEKNERQKLITIFISAGGLLLIGFLLFVFNRLKVTKKQKEEINKQKEEIAFQHEQLEVNHKEIRDSITYAKRLQKAILPSQNEITKYIAENFIYFKPKDVVSGDFYWFEKIGSTIFVAAADCTGHGVPGAMVSVVCSNALSRSVKEFGLTEPNEILNKTRELVVQRFSISGEEVEDGMDISLCVFQGDKMKFAGANNPVWVVKPKLNVQSAVSEKFKITEYGEQSLIEIKGNRKPVGIYRDMSPFDQHEISLENGDLIYLFSDGFTDQFGGENLVGKLGGKKFKYKPFKKFILGMNQMTMEEQFEHIDRTFHLWKGDFEQVDDICIIGLKF